MYSYIYVITVYNLYHQSVTIYDMLVVHTLLTVATLQLVHYILRTYAYMLYNCQLHLGMYTLLAIARAVSPAVAAVISSIFLVCSQLKFVHTVTYMQSSNERHLNRLG